jgi:hypothetical protein
MINVLVAPVAPVAVVEAFMQVVRELGVLLS